ncbi:MAG: hypothetical protein M3P06_05580 [Acidobacteriota bacterium]|nr:hypothetical protein [Acidobacteriota bacterium]
MTRLWWLFPILLVTRVAFANTPPAAPVILEPAVELQALNGADVHMVTAEFVDVDGDEHRCTDWEIREGTELVWSATCVEASLTIHVHLGDGVFSGTHAGAFDVETRLRLRVEARDDLPL